MMKASKYSVAFVLGSSFVLVTSAQGQDNVAVAAQAGQSVAQPVGQIAPETSEQVQQLAAPIALYPDSLVAQILAASTYPAEVVDASHWMQQHSGLDGQVLADAVDPQPWDPSVKALTQFPSVLDNMNRNLAWTSALGDAYVNQPQDVLNAVQLLRQRAQAAGNLQSNSEQTVTAQDQTIDIEPANPAIVYVPSYDPWLAYGAPLVAYPGWVPYPGDFYNGPGLYYGAGIGIGFLAAFGWGWHNWGFDWRDRRLTFRDEPFLSHSRTFFNRRDFAERGAQFDRGDGHFDQRPRDFNRGGERPFAAQRFADAPHGTQGLRPRGDAQGFLGSRPGAFSGFDHGGIAMDNSSRGRLSFGGGFHAAGPSAGGVQRSGGFRGGGEGGFRGGGGGGFHGGGGGGFHASGGGGGGGRGGGGGGGHGGGGGGGGHR
jgi:hypothetical protein